MTNAFTYEAAKTAKFETLGDVFDAAYCIRALTVQLADRLNDERDKRGLKAGSAEYERIRAIEKLFEDDIWLVARKASLAVGDLINGTNTAED